MDCCNATDPGAFDAKCIKLAAESRDSAKYAGDFEKWTPLLATWYKKAGRVAEAKNADKVLVEASMTARKLRPAALPKGEKLASLLQRDSNVGGSAASTTGSTYTGIRGMPRR